MMDFSNATLPSLKPLSNSFTQSGIEEELRQLSIDLFSMISESTFDANAIGMSQLGSMDLVRRAMTFDGLETARSDGEEPAARYLFRAWKSGNNQGRGLHFLRTYMQMLFPNEWCAYQLAQDKASPYPKKLVDVALVSEATHYLTSRVRISVEAQNVNAESLNSVRGSIASILPARFIPSFALTQTVKSNQCMASIFSGFIRIDSTGALKNPDFIISANEHAVSVASGATSLVTHGTLIN